MDQDGYGDPKNSIDSCDGAPGNYTTNYQDCNDSNDKKWIGATCQSGCACITTIDDSCNCAISDPDEDGVCDGIDVCPEEDDTIDTNNDGIPDCSVLPCTEAQASFSKTNL